MSKPYSVKIDVERPSVERFQYLLERWLGQDHCCDVHLATEAIDEYCNRLERKLDARDRRCRIKNLFLKKKVSR